MNVTPEQVDTWLNALAWVLTACTVLWIATSIVGHLHRRNYNLTKADASGGKVVRPDFLDVDHKARREAIRRGETYEKQLDAREAAAKAPPTTAESAGRWARWAATGTAIFTLAGTILGTFSKVSALEQNIQQVGSWDQFVQTVSDHKLGATIAFAVIGAQIVLFVQANRRTSSPR
jgi:hypothetical protein